SEPAASDRADAVASEPAWPHDGSDLAPDPAVVYGELENGLRYILLENDTPTGTAALRLRIDGGSLDETDEEAGLSHFLEHMAFNGSQNVPEGEMIKILERYGLAFGPDTNAFTSFDQVQYQLDLPSTEAEIVETGLFLMRETASNLTLAEDAIDRERGVIASEARARNSFGLRRFEHLITFLAPETPLADRLPIGDADVVANAPAERFRTLYESYYRPERTVLVAVGDFETGVMADRIESAFGDWVAPPRPDRMDLPSTIDETRGLETALFVDPDVPTIISINAVIASDVRPDTGAERKRLLLRRIGNAILSRRFARLAREPDAIFLNAGAGQSDYFTLASVASVDLTTTPENWQAALAVGEQELRRAIEYGFTASELAEQIANLRTGLENAAEQADTRRTPSLADALAGAINDDQVFTTPESALARFESYADEITPEAVHAAFRTQWTQGGGPLIHLSNKSEIDNAEAEIVTAWTASTTVEVTPPDGADVATFAYTDFGSPGEIIRDEMIDDLGIRTIVFDNSVRLNLKSTDFEDGRVRISLRFGGGLLEFPPTADGLPLFMSIALPQGGLEAHSVDDLQSIFAGRSVSFGLSAGSDAFGARVTTTPDDLALQMQILAASVTAPGYRQEGEAQYRQTLDVFYPTLDAEPGGIVSRDVDRILRNGDIRFGIGPVDTLSAHTFDDLKAVIDDAFRNGAVEIGMVGDFEDAAAIAAVAATFGALPERRAERQAFEAARKVRFPEDRSARTLTHEGPADKALALVYWPTDDNRDQKATYTRNLLRAVLRLKLTETLREALGATYSPGTRSTSSSVYPGYGFLSASSEVEPGDIETIFAAIDEITGAMASGSISDDELKRARQPILESLEEGLESNGSWLGIVDEAQTEPGDLERWRTSADVYAAITTEDLVEAAATWLKPDDALRISIVSSEAE
ncbi:MAG: insulinase family protein, partial [Pseudomonadota bacterium]